jgi:A/G-specific adenine glycosylase
MPALNSADSVSMADTLTERKPARKGVAQLSGKPVLSSPLLAWYDRHARTLPWRIGPAARRHGERQDPYRVWLSEIMLQQTTVKAVLPYYMTFTHRWPDVFALAAANDDAVMAAWAGLGYYSRARNLIACARQIRDNHDGRFPGKAADLARLPGIGAYTSAAIAAIAFDEPVAVVDGNVERVIARFFAIETPLPVAKADVCKQLAPMVPPDRAGEFAEAMMDLGATICSPRGPACSLCPLAGGCRAFGGGRQGEFPVRPAKKQRPTRYGEAYVAIRDDGAVLLRKRPPKGLLGGMAEVPGTVWTELRQSEDAAPIAGNWQISARDVEHTFTHFHLVLNVRHARFAMATAVPDEAWWSPAEALPYEALPSVMKKAIEAVLPGATKKPK